MLSLRSAILISTISPLPLMNARFLRRDLHFIRPAVTSRGSLTLKETYFIELTDPGRPGVVGIGECALFRGLGADDRPGYAEKVAELCDSINRGLPLPDLSDRSSIRFGLEMAPGLARCRRQWHGVSIRPDKRQRTRHHNQRTGVDGLARQDGGSCHGQGRIRIPLHQIQDRRLRFQSRTAHDRAVATSVWSRPVEIRLDANGASARRQRSTASPARSCSARHPFA